MKDDFSTATNTQRRPPSLPVPRNGTGLALSKLHDELSGYINKHPGAACIIAGGLQQSQPQEGHAELSTTYILSN